MIRRGGRNRRLWVWRGAAACCVLSSAICAISLFRLCGLQARPIIVSFSGGAIGFGFQGTNDPKWVVSPFRWDWEKRDIRVDLLPQYAKSGAPWFLHMVSVPLWPLIVVSGFVSWRLWPRHSTAERPCERCGYELEGLEPARAVPSKCPECGAEIGSRRVRE